MTPNDATASFLEALRRDLPKIRKEVAELDGLWGKAIGHGGIDPRVTSTLKRKLGVVKAGVRDLEKLAAGEVPE
jgi:hypothetical protein